MADDPVIVPLDQVDLALVKTCANPKCRRKVRVFSSTGTGAAWWCPRCLRAKIDAALGVDRSVPPA